MFNKQPISNVVKIPPKDAFIALRHVDKIYPNKVQAVFDFNLNIQKHDFVVFVGPSGCGKSTTLRMVAGLEDITCGDLFIDGEYANDLASKDRDIAMVFQSYALYPHMTVAENMAFGLKIRKFPVPQYDENGKPILAIDNKKVRQYQEEVDELTKLINNNMIDEEQLEDAKYALEQAKKQLEYYKNTQVPVTKMRKLSKDEIHQRVIEAAQILQIEEYLDRKPRALSGGQCQRVALGRSIVRNAKLFLMDEPLSNLDAKLRVTMRSEIIKLHERLNATTIYVTHDQTEAMTMATKIVVMSKGYIQQIGSPTEIFEKPANIFVATFIGSPSMNLIRGVVAGNKLYFANKDSITLTKEQIEAVNNFYVNELDKYEKERNFIISNFTEYQEVSALLINASGEEKEELKARLKEVASTNDRLSFLNVSIEKYKTYIEKKEYQVIFGIRPENIFGKFDHIDKGLNVKEITGEVTVSELTGLEYFVHFDYNNQDFVARIKSKERISAGDQYKISLDLSASHIFDSVSEKRIG